MLSVSHDPVLQSLKNTVNTSCQEIWDIPPNQDAVFACAMEQVLEVYERPYDPKHPTVCMHETTKQCVREIRATQPMRYVPSVRYDAEYERNGVAHLLLFYMPLGNWRRVVVQRDCAASAWAEGIRQLVEEDFPEAQRITMVTDNLDTHHGASLYEAFPPVTACRLTDKLEFVYTPKHGSWLNMAECESSVLNSQCLKRRTRDVNTVKEEVVSWANHCNNHSEPAQWRFTKGDARTKFPRLYSRISN